MKPKFAKECEFGIRSIDDERNTDTRFLLEKIRHAPETDNADKRLLAASNLGRNKALGIPRDKALLGKTARKIQWL